MSREVTVQRVCFRRIWLTMQAYMDQACMSQAYMGQAYMLEAYMIQEYMVLTGSGVRVGAGRVA